MLIIPYFKDGVIVKTDDLTRLKEYSVNVATALMKGNTAGPGILYGMSLIQSGSNYVLQPGAARLQSGEIVIIDSTDTITIPVSDVTAITSTPRCVWLYKTGTSIVSSREDLAHIPQTVASKDIFALTCLAPAPAATPPTTSSKVLLGTITTISSTPLVRIAADTLNTHTNTWVGDNYTGPQITSAGIANGEVKTVNLETSRSTTTGVTTPKLADFAVTGAKIAANTISADKMLQDTITMMQHGRMFDQFMQGRSFYDFGTMRTNAPVYFSGPGGSLNVTLYKNSTHMVGGYGPTSFAGAEIQEGSVIRIGPFLFYCVQGVINQSFSTNMDHTGGYYTRPEIRTNGVYCTPIWNSLTTQFDNTLNWNADPFPNPITGIHMWRIASRRPKTYLFSMMVWATIDSTTYTNIFNP